MSKAGQCFSQSHYMLNLVFFPDIFLPMLLIKIKANIVLIFAFIFMNSPTEFTG